MSTYFKKIKTYLISLVYNSEDEQEMTEIEKEKKFDKYFDKLTRNFLPGTD